MRFERGDAVTSLAQTGDSPMRADGPKAGETLTARK
jgi:DNA gyrase subunit B